MKRPSLFDTLLVLCALVVTGLLVRKELFPRAQLSANELGANKEIPIAGWDTLRVGGHVLAGPASAPVEVHVFSDFECPACRDLAARGEPGLLAAFPGKIRVVHRYWPLPYHRFAMPMAIASNCAAEQERFPAFHDLAFKFQDSLGLKSMASLAMDAGVRDTAAFSACLVAERGRTLIERDAAIIAAAGGMGTPSVVINGTLYTGLADSLALHQKVTELLGSMR